jgi:hypothetical protein
MVHYAMQPQASDFGTGYAESETSRESETGYAVTVGVDGWG